MHRRSLLALAAGAADPADQRRSARAIQAGALHERVYIPTGQHFYETACSARLRDVSTSLFAFRGVHFA